MARGWQGLESQGISLYEDQKCSFICARLFSLVLGEHCMSPCVSGQPQEN